MDGYQQDEQYIRRNGERISRGSGKRRKPLFEARSTERVSRGVLHQTPPWQHSLFPGPTWTRRLPVTTRRSKRDRSSGTRTTSSACVPVPHGPPEAGTGGVPGGGETWAASPDAMAQYFRRSYQPLPRRGRRRGGVRSTAFTRRVAGVADREFLPRPAQDQAQGNSMKPCLCWKNWLTKRPILPKFTTCWVRSTTDCTTTPKRSSVFNVLWTSIRRTNEVKPN